MDPLLGPISRGAQGQNSPFCGIEPPSINFDYPLALLRAPAKLFLLGIVLNIFACDCCLGHVELPQLDEGDCYGQGHTTVGHDYH